MSRRAGPVGPPPALDRLPPETPVIIAGEEDEAPYHYRRCQTIRQSDRANRDRTRRVDTDRRPCRYCEASALLAIVEAVGGKDAPVLWDLVTDRAEEVYYSPKKGVAHLPDDEKPLCHDHWAGSTSYKAKIKPVGAFPPGYLDVCPRCLLEAVGVDGVRERLGVDASVGGPDLDFADREVTASVE